MIKKHTHGKKFIAWLLTLSMLLSLVPGMAFATSEQPPEVPATTTVAAPTITPASGTLVAGQTFKIKPAKTWYTIVTDGTVPTAQQIKETGEQSPNRWTMPVKEIKEDCIVYAVVEKDGVFSEVTSAAYTVSPVVEFGYEMGGTIKSLASYYSAINVSKHYVKIPTLTGATEYYYLASTVEQSDITAEQVAATGVKVNADTFDEIKNGNEVVHLGNDGGVIYIYAVAKKGDNQYTPVTAAQYKVAPVSMDDINMTPSTTDPVMVGDQVKLTFDTLPAEYNKFNPTYTYTVNGGEPVPVTPQNGTATADVTLSSVGDNVIKFNVTSAELGSAFDYSTSVTIKAVADADDATLTYGNGQTKSFSGALLNRVGQFMVDQNINEAKLTLKKDIGAEEFLTPLIVPKNKTITLDFNGKSLTSDAPAENDKTGVGLCLEGEGSKLIVENSKSTGGVITTKGNAIGMVFNGKATQENPAVVTINGGTFKHSAGANGLLVSGEEFLKVVVNNGTFDTSASDKTVFMGSEVEINNATITGGAYPVFGHEGKLTIKDCNVTCTASSIFDRSGQIVIDGGTFTTTGNYITGDKVNDFTINGGTFKCAEGHTLLPGEGDWQTTGFFGSGFKYKENHELWYDSQDKSFKLRAVQNPVVPEVPVPEAPEITPVSGEVATGQQITITCATNGAKIFYTTDGTNPTGQSTEYTQPFAINKGCTVKAIAMNGDKQSEPASATYTIKADTPSVADDMTLSYGEKTQAFNGGDLSAVSKFMRDKSIQEATLKLNKDVNFTSTLTLPKGSKFTLDLNGYKLSTSSRIYCINTEENFEGKLIITDTSTGSVKGVISTLNRDDVTVNLSRSNTGKKSTLVINGGVTIEKGVSTYNADVTIENATLKKGIKIRPGSIPEKPICSMSNSTFNGQIAQGIGELTVTNCNVTNTSGDVFSTEHAKVTINGGIYTSNSGVWQLMDGAQTLIKGDAKFFTSASDTLTAFGFNTPRCESGKMLTYDTSEKCWKLTQLNIADSGNLAVTPVNGTHSDKAKVEEAFEAVKASGGKIQLKADSNLTGNVGLVITSDVVLDLNGHTLTLSPAMNAIYAGAIDVANGGHLTICDSSADRTGKLNLTQCDYGITISGSTACFTMEGGTINGAKLRTLCRDWQYGGVEKAFSGTITMTGGKISQPGGTGMITAISILGSDPDDEEPAPINGKVIISGGEIVAQGNAEGLSVAGVNLTINDSAKIISENNTAVDVGFNTITVSGKALISSSSTPLRLSTLATGSVAEQAKIIHTGSDEAVIVDGFNTSLTVDGTAKLESTGKCVIFGKGNTTITLNGGLYKMGANTLLTGEPEGTTPGIKTLQYKTDDSYTGINADMKFYILNAKPDKDEYYDVVRRQDLHLKNQLNKDVGYQNMENLDYAIKAADAALLAEGQGDNAYTTDTKKAVTDAKAMAEKYIADKNANQHDIELIASRLNEAVAGLKTQNAANPNKLANGTYEVAISALRHETPAGFNASMTSGALEPKGNVVINDDKAELHLFFKPTVVMDMVGHLVNLYYYEGNTPEENKANSNSGVTPTLCKTNKYYTIPANDPDGMTDLGQVGPKAEWDEERAKDPNTGYDKTPVHFPREVVIPLNYRGTENGADRYICRVSVDKMNELKIGEQDVDLVIRWSTLKPVDVQATLKVEPTEVTLVKGGTQKIEAEVLGDEGYTTTYAVTKGTENVSVNGTGEITAKKTGTATITVTATKANAEALTKDINVTVAEDGKKAITADSKLKGDTVKAEITGDVLVTNGNAEQDKIDNTSNIIKVDATTTADTATAAEVGIATATADALAAANKSVEIKTNFGTVKLDTTLMDQIANANDKVTLKINNEDPTIKPSGNFGIQKYISLELVAGGKKVDFGQGQATVTVECAKPVSYAYYLVNGDFKEQLPATYNGDAKTATWTTNHFSDWALTKQDIIINDSKPGGDGNEPGVLPTSDGNYYVDIDLWHATDSQASMGDIAFEKNPKALVTVSGDKVTKVQIATNTVDVGDKNSGNVIHSGITAMSVDGTPVNVLETGKLVTKPANKNYDYIKLASFTMPDEGQPKDARTYTYAPVHFTVPDTPMDEVVESLDARLRFNWSTATKTNDTTLVAHGSDDSDVKPDVKPGIVENPDGSKTETVVKPDGTVVETTTGKEDGSTIEKVTTPDGTVSEKTTQKDGTYVENITKKDGTVTEKTLDKEGTLVDKTTQKNGTITETTTTKAGKVTAEVTVPKDQKQVVVNIPKDNLKSTEVAVVTKADGSKEVIKKSVVGEDGLKLVLDENTKLEIVDNSKNFNDVSDKHWGNKAVDFVASREIFNGTGEKTFAPDATMTRGMLVQVLYNFENRPEGSKNADFGDVKDDAWFADAVAWAADNKIVAGVGDNNFAPNQEISREQLVTILYRYAGEPKVKGSLDKYSDASKVSSYAQDAMLWAVENGIVSGMGNNTLAPQGDATRAQVAQIMMNFCDWIII